MLRNRVRTLAMKTGLRARPHFLILGAQKAGTSALFDYLARHPRLVCAREKEVGYFTPEIARVWSGHPHSTVLARLDGAHEDSHLRRRAENWYASLFPVPRPWRSDLFFEATPEYLHFPQAAARIRSFRPEMKLVAILRDPVERAYSAWKMYHNFTGPDLAALRDPRSFEQAMLDELEGRDAPGTPPGADYLARGIYHAQLRRYLEVFPAEQVLIVENGELASAQGPTLNRVCRFLGVHEFGRWTDQARVLAGPDETPMSSEIRTRLARFFAPHNALLYAMIGRRFAWTEALADEQTHPVLEKNSGWGGSDARQRRMSST